MNVLRVPVLAVMSMFAAEPAPSAEPPKVVLAIHGGAGTIPRAQFTAEQEKLFRADLEQALRAGHQVLDRGGRSLDAVETAIKVLEDSPRFNAGKGAVFTHEGRNELDASIMEGKGKKAGAVAAVTRVKNPIAAARAVLDRSEHVLLVGDGAERFVFRHGVAEVSPVYFWTEHRWQQLQEAQRRALPDKPGGTVGAVALDRHGDLAAGTSTGGMTNKRFGRVGDSPIIGAGTYADNAACAVSATGHGEFFIRYAVAHEIVALMKYRGLTVQAAADDVVLTQLKKAGGDGGVIALDARGRAAFAFNTPGMYRGHITEGGVVHVAVHDR